jgi:hypothetical protein
MSGAGNPSRLRTIAAASPMFDVSVGSTELHRKPAHPFA